MLNNNELTGVLALLRNARIKLLSRSELENPELFKNLFEFENNFELLNLAFEREFNLWVDGHFEEFEDDPELAKSQVAIRYFHELMVNLVQSRVIKTTSEKDIASRDFCISLLSEKISVINEFISVSKKSTKQYQRLLYLYHKDKALFEREFKRLMEKYNMSWLSKLGGALVDCVSKPIDALCEWATEPLESRCHDRNESARASSHQREVELQESRIKAESEAKIREKESEVEHEVKRVKEIELAIAEIDEWKKDKEFERMKKTTEAIMSYQEQLTKLNVNAINAIGHMQLELRERAQSLVYEKTIQYKELQDLAMKDAIADLHRIEEQFSDNDRAKDILTSAVDKKLANVIDTAQNFLLELNRDIKSLNEGISLLAEKGQSFIENHLDRFHVSNSVLLENKDQEKLISNESTKCLTSKSSGR